MQTSPDPLLAHILACRSAQRDGAPLWYGDQAIGRVQPAAMPVLGRLLRTDPAGFRIAPDASGTSIEALGEEMAREGLYRPHGELFDVVAHANAPAIGRIDRGALPLLGLLAQGVHVNGLVARPDGLHLWIGRRSPHKRLDPGKLDHIVAGGMSTGLDPAQALVKEAAEEASLPSELARTARPVGVLGYAMTRPEGFRRDLLHCFDLFLPDGVTPAPADGEVVSFELVAMPGILARVSGTADFKFNVNLVLIDLFIRHRLVDEARAGNLRAALNANMAQARVP